MRPALLDLLKRTAPFTWNLFASVATQGATLVTNFAIIRLTSVHLFGQYNAIQTAVLALVAIFQLSAWFSAIKFTAELVEKDSRRLEEILGLLSLTTFVAGAVATLALAVSARWYASTALRDPGLELGVVIAAASVLFNILASLQSGVLLGFGATRVLAQSAFFLLIPMIALPSALAFFGGIDGALFGLTTGAVLRFGVTELFLRKELKSRGLRIRYQNFRQNLSVLSQFALPASANSLTNAGATWLVSIAIVHTKAGFTDVALFGTISTLKTLALFVPYQINNVSIALINRAQKGRLGQSLFRSNLLFLVGFSLVSALVISAAAAPIMKAYSASFVRGTGALRLFMAGSILEALSYGLMQHFSAGRKLWLPFLFGALPRDVVYVLLSLLLLSQFEVDGVALAYGASWTVCAAGYLLLIAARADSASARKLHGEL